MVAEQTAGRREIAADGYIDLLASEDCPKSVYVQEFIQDQLILCLLFSYRLDELLEILKKEESRETPRRTIPIVNINSCQIASMIKYEDDKDRSVADLSGWETLEPTKDFGNDFSYYSLICLTESTLVKSCFPGHIFNNNLSEQCFEIIHNSLHECLRTKSRENLDHLTLLNHMCHKLSKHNQNREIISLESLCVDKSVATITLMRILTWTELFEDMNNSAGGPQSTDIRLNLSSRQRKEGNLRFCKNELTKFFKKSDYAKRLNLIDKLDVDSVQEKFIKSENIADVTIWDENISRGVYETCKLMYCSPKQKNQAIQLAASAALGICNRLKAGIETPQLKERAARVLLTLSEWLLLENDTIITSDQNSSLVHLLATLPDITPHPDESTPAAIPIIDASVGKLIQHGIKQCPDLTKAWGALGNW